MKKILFILTACILVFSCEEVIDVDLKNDIPRLVVEASMNWARNTDGKIQRIKLTTTTGFFDEEIPLVSGAEITVTDAHGAVFSFIEETEGDYVCRDFVPELNTEYTLEIKLNGEIFKAVETFLPTAEITEITQSSQNYFGTEVVEIKYFFQDNGSETNFYMENVTNPHEKKPWVFVVSDEFFQGNLMHSLIVSDLLKAGDTVGINFSGISKRYYNYMLTLSTAAGVNGGGPFQIPVGTVRGNIVNTTNPKNFALGYFRLSQVDSVAYIVE